MADSNVRARLLRACYAFMVPVARFLLRSGISFKEFAEISRMAFVEVAGRDYGLRGRPTNSSRVAAMTGIARKEVRRLRNLTTANDLAPPVDLSPLGDVLHHWLTDPAYLSPDGKPKILPIQGRKTSFENLVRAYAGDIPAGAVKAELVRLGSVAEDSRGKLRVLKRQMIPSPLEEKLATSLSYGLRGLASTVAFNTGAKDREAADRLERLCISDSLSERAIVELLPILKDQASALLERVDKLVAKAERDKFGRRIGIGIYYYEDE